MNNQIKNKNNKRPKSQPEIEAKAKRKLNNGKPMDVSKEKTYSYGDQILSQMENGYGKTLSMYPSTLAFAKVYTDPYTTEGARVPVFPIVSSSLEKYYATGKGTCNNSGNGWITVTPLNFATYDVESVGNSNNDTGDGVMDPGTSGPTLSHSSSPHSISDFYEDTGTKSVRVVSIGIRIRYLGTTLNAAGTCLTAQMSPLGDGASGETYTTTKQLPGFKEYTFKDTSWHSITRHIEAQQDTFFCEFNNASSRWIFPDSNSHPFDENHRIFAYISAEPKAPFEWEVSAHFEILGTNLVRRGLTTPDTNGFEHIVGTMAERRQRDSTTKDHNVGGTWSNLVNFLKQGAKKTIPLIPSLISKILL